MSTDKPSVRASRSPQLAQHVRELRRSGLSYGEICAHVSAPRGTIVHWCRGIHLDDVQVADLNRRVNLRRRRPTDTQRARHVEVARIQDCARSFALSNLGDSFFTAGTTLYWAEGAKTTRRLLLANTDPAALRLFIGWVRRFHMPDAEFVLGLHLHDGNDEPAARSHWASVLELTRPTFQKSHVKAPGTGHRNNRLPHGVCRVSVRRSTDAWIRTMAWIEVLAERLGAE